MTDIEKLINQRNYKDAAALSIYRGTTYETRALFAEDEYANVEKKDAFENLLLADAHHDFDCYCRFLDFRQKLSRNFYLDRRKYLKPIADAFTDMYFPKEDAETLDVIRIKLRTRSGKSEFFNRAAFWVQGNNPEGETLYCVGGGRLSDNIYEKRVAFIDEYWDRHQQVFPEASVEKKSKELASVWLRKSEYADISTVTIGGSMEGHVQCTNMLVLDDLVSSTEINSVKRLEEIYSSDILNAVMRRYISGKIVLIGTPIPTLTGVTDPSDAFYNNRKLAGYNCAEFAIPSLNDDMVSNYSYRDWSGTKGKSVLRFTTEEFLRERRTAYNSGNDLEVATFETIFQMKPMEQGARRFAHLKRYEEKHGLYKEINILDTADKGSDAAVCIHARIYNDEPHLVYVHDIFHDTRPMDIAENGGFLDDYVQFLIRNDIHLLKYEENMGGTLLGEKLSDMCKEIGYTFNYETYRQTKNKVQRILDMAMEVINVVRIKDVPPTKSYDTAVKEVISWSEKSKHDDTADCLTKVVEEFVAKDAEKPNQFLMLNKPIF